MLRWPSSSIQKHLLRRAVGGVIEPRAAANHAQRSPIVVAWLPVLAPFLDVAEQVVNPQARGRQRRHGVGMAVGIGSAPRARRRLAF